ncbi:MAG: molecular chaperone DnaK [Methylotenera sp.]|jgi:DnaK suppressor protein|nr:MAG: molecular chaperone DnaK [Methylotenera sp.]
MEDNTLQVLLDKLTALQTSIVEASKNAAPVILDQSSQGRLSRMDAMQQQQLACNLIYRMKQDELKLQAAVNRFHDGTYGICCKCGDLIDQHRLNVDLATPFCSACASN